MDNQSGNADGGPERWGAYLTAVVGREVNRHRRAQGLKVVELADRCASIGYPIARSTIAKLEAAGSRLARAAGEGGEPFDASKVLRSFVTVQEMLVLAEALGVPPVLLTTPVYDGQIEVLPSRPMPAWEAFEWVVGMDDPRWNTPERSESVQMLTLYREYVRVLRQIRYLTRAPEEIPDEETLAKRLAAERGFALTLGKTLEIYLELYGARVSLPSDLADYVPTVPESRENV